jgi:hypothetical protein
MHVTPRYAPYDGSERHEKQERSEAEASRWFNDLTRVQLQRFRDRMMGKRPGRCGWLPNLLRRSWGLEHYDGATLQGVRCMSRRPARFTQADVARAIRAAKQAGAGDVIVATDGSIVIRIAPEPVDVKPLDGERVVPL